MLELLVVVVVLVVLAGGVITAASQRPECAETPQPIIIAEMLVIPAIVVFSCCCAPPEAHLCALRWPILTEGRTARRLVLRIDGIDRTSYFDRAIVVSQHGNGYWTR
jgi:hypothetical protein